MRAQAELEQWQAQLLAREKELIAVGKQQAATELELKQREEALCALELERRVKDEHLERLQQLFGNERAAGLAGDAIEP